MFVCSVSGCLRKEKAMARFSASLTTPHLIRKDSIPPTMNGLCLGHELGLEADICVGMFVRIGRIDETVSRSEEARTGDLDRRTRDQR